LYIAYGSDYIHAKWYLVGITVTQLFQCYRMQFESIFNGIDKPKHTTKTSAISVVVNMITAPFLVILFGGLGVIYSTILAEIFRITVYQNQIKNIFGRIILPRGVMTQIVIFFGLYIIITIFSSIVSLSSFNQLIFSSFISIVGFYSLQYIFSEETRIIVSEYKSEINVI